MGADFSGYATKFNVRCSDGRTITSEAFAHMDGLQVPLVWQHIHNDPTNVLGHAVLEKREDGMYAHGFFNETDAAQHAKKMVEHGDVNAMSIYANKLVEKSKSVLHGVIREVSLVLSGANPGALIENVSVVHGDDIDVLEDEVVIYSDETLSHADDDKDEKTVQDVLDSLTEEQKTVVYFLIGRVSEEQGSDEAKHSDDLETELSDGEIDTQKVLESLTPTQQTVVHSLLEDALKESALKHSDNNQEGTSMSRRIFEPQDRARDNGGSGDTLTHSDLKSIVTAAHRNGSLKEAFEDHIAKNELKHGIDEIDLLFPDAKNVLSTPELVKRRTEWVNEVITGTTKTPFSRIKSLTANLTLDEARAKGYVKGNMKKEEFFRISKRVTTPQTIYKKQKLDRDDIVDITDFDVVIWLKAEMRIMLEEEIARAILIGDGRSAGDDDKIKEEHIRPIATDSDFYVTTLFVNLADADSSPEEIIDALVLQRRHYRGSGNPVFFTSETVLAKLLLIKDKQGRRIYPTVNDVAVAIRASRIIAVEVMDEPGNDVLGILVNLKDYNVGADRGGEVSLFDDFDIDFNQYKYLIETRMSGALIKAKSALVVRQVAGTSVLVSPVAPSWNASTHTVTVPTTTGITYKNKLTNATLTTASPVTLDEDDELIVVAVPASSSYHLASNAEDEFLFTYEDGLVEGFIG